MAESNIIKGELLSHSINGVKVLIRAEDGYCHATSMCKAAHKKWHDYYRLTETQKYIKVVEAETGIPASELIQALRGGNRGQGTWVHPDIALNLATWLDAEIAYQVTKIVKDWVAGRNGNTQQQLPAITAPKVITHVTIIENGIPRSKIFHEPAAVVPAAAFYATVKGINDSLLNSMTASSKLMSKLTETSISTRQEPDLAQAT